MRHAHTLIGIICLFHAVAFAEPSAKRPNILLIITDDQGFGDLGVHGNPVIKTPNLDRLAGESTQFSNFYVSPVCTPTRASLMTGRYNYRTGAIDTFMGRAMMWPDEITLAELLRGDGYRTGIFGKWHLGDHYPLRAMDQGFEESLVHNGGGLAQTSDPPEGNSYFGPILHHNGKPVKTSGYCSDVYTDAAIKYMEEHQAEPFFVYLPFNAPHVPLQCPEAYSQPYKEMNLAMSEFPAVGNPVTAKVDADALAKLYGMVTNIDDNVGRVLKKLDDLHLAKDTIVIFMTDNGPQSPRYNSGLRGTKGSPYDGGIRVPFFIRWPGKFEAGGKVANIAAHIDVMPTLIEACGVGEPYPVHIDGVSLMPLLTKKGTAWPDRTLYFQWHRGDTPQQYRAFAARSPQYKLVQAGGMGDKPLPEKPEFELFDMLSDPYEMNNIAAENPDVVSAMKEGYEIWFKGVSLTRGYEPPAILVGTAYENPVLLTRQDMRSATGDSNQNGAGFFKIDMRDEGPYDLTLIFKAAEAGGKARINLGRLHLDVEVPPNAERAEIRNVRLPVGITRLVPAITRGDSRTGVNYVEIRSHAPIP